jgi:cation diffusion facilitator CzcD-associated flavoprotein CzcO
VSGAGPLTEPKIPDLPGLDEFEGATFHSARWDHDFDLKGKRVVSIGTGASAIQYVPAIQPEVERLTVFQRTPPWVMPHPNRRITERERRLYRAVPAAQRIARGGAYLGREWLVLGFAKNPKIMKIADRIARRHIAEQVPDPALRAKVTPDYTIGCKRILPSNKWYPALSQPNVDLVAGGVERVTRTGVVGTDGVERPADAIIFGTGFQVTDVPVAKWLRGRRGSTLEETWGGSMRALLGTSVADFPNLFLLLGPNTGLGHSSMVYMIESQVAHVVAALKAMRDRGADVVEVRPEAVEAYNRELDAKMERTVWNTGCQSWYLDDTGRNATLWPDWTFRFRQRAARFDEGAYRFEHAPRFTRAAEVAA